MKQKLLLLLAMSFIATGAFAQDDDMAKLGAGLPDFNPGKAPHPAVVVGGGTAFFAAGKKFKAQGRMNQVSNIADSNQEIKDLSKQVKQGDMIKVNYTKAGTEYDAYTTLKNVSPQQMEAKLEELTQKGHAINSVKHTPAKLANSTAKVTKKMNVLIGLGLAVGCYGLAETIFDDKLSDALTEKFGNKSQKRLN